MTNKFQTLSEAVAVHNEHIAKWAVIEVMQPNRIDRSKELLVEEIEVLLQTLEDERNRRSEEPRNEHGGFSTGRGQ